MISNKSIPIFATLLGYNWASSIPLMCTWRVYRTKVSEGGRRWEGYLSWLTTFYGYVWSHQVTSALLNGLLVLYFLSKPIFAKLLNRPGWIACSCTISKKMSWNNRLTVRLGVGSIVKTHKRGLLKYLNNFLLRFHYAWLVLVRNWYIVVASDQAVVQYFLY